MIAQKMVDSKLHLSVAESCTGGVLTSILTTIPGASTWFNEGLITYTLQSKSKRLGLSPEFLTTHGLVSQKVSEAMARQVALTSESDIGIGITGNAGPDVMPGQSPLGLVFISLYANNVLITQTHQYDDSRLIIREKASRVALDMLFDYLMAIKAS